MATSDTTRSKTLFTLATKLERLERGLDAVEADSFQDVVARLKAELAATPPGTVLDAVLTNFPCTAELYENLNYEVAGLCRSNLDVALKGERRAREAIDAARRPTQA